MAIFDNLGGYDIAASIASGDLRDEIDLKADIDGYYAQLTAGAADNLTGRGDATTAEFLYRTAGGTADIETGQAVAKSIKGNTLVWNQLNVGVNGTQQVEGLTRTVNADGSLTITGTVTTAPDYHMLYLSSPISLKRDGRKYLFKASKDAGLPLCVSGYASTTGTRVFIWSNNNGGTWNGALSAYVVAGDTVNITNLKCMVIDLTAMFGAGNEPSTVAEFEALFPLPYYEYDAGSLLSVNMEGIETTGFNQWDEEWELGGYSSVNGNPIPYTDRIRSKNPIPVFPSTEYCVRCDTSVNFIVNTYDADGAFIENVVGTAVGQDGKTFTTPANTQYIEFSPTATYGTTYKHDICINLSWSGRRNGEYESYWSSQRLIDVATYFPDGMRSAGSVYDELTSTEAIQRVGVVDLGTLTWNKATDGSKQFIVSRTNFPELQAWSDINLVGNIICPKYTAVKYNDASALYGNIDKTIAVGGVTNAIAVLDSAYESATAAEFKTAMSGVMLYYALATPIVTPIDPALNLSYRVDDFGTERVMVPENERSAPPVLDIAYGLNVVDFVRRAPTEYISAASFRQYLLARDAHDGTTTTMTWDDTDNRYEFVITDTVTEG